MTNPYKLGLLTLSQDKLSERVKALEDENRRLKLVIGLLKSSPTKRAGGRPRKYSVAEQQAFFARLDDELRRRGLTLPALLAQMAPMPSEPTCRERVRYERELKSLGNGLSKYRRTQSKIFPKTKP